MKLNIAAVNFFYILPTIVGANRVLKNNKGNGNKSVQTSSCQSSSAYSGPYDFTSGGSYQCAGGFKIEDGDLPNTTKSEWQYSPSNGCTISIVPTEWKDNDLVTFDYSVDGDCAFDTVEVKWNTSYFLYDTNCASSDTCLGSQVYPDPKTGNINGISHIQFCPEVDGTCGGSSSPPPPAPTSTSTGPTQPTAPSGPTPPTQPTTPTSPNSNPTPSAPSTPTEPTGTYEAPGNGGKSAESCAYSECSASLSVLSEENRYQGGWSCPNNNGFKIGDENMPTDPSLTEYSYSVTAGGDWGEECTITLKDLVWKDDELIEFGYSVEGDCCVHQTEVKYGPTYVTYEFESFAIPFGEDDSCLRSSGCKGISHIQFCPAISCEYPSTVPSAMPSLSPSASPSSAPSSSPTAEPSASPSSSPTSEPSSSPSSVPSSSPTSEPTTSPSSVPSVSPTSEPTSSPTAVPTARPTSKPSASPSTTPTANPSSKPSSSPTSAESDVPSKTPVTSPTITITSPNENPTPTITSPNENPTPTITSPNENSTPTPPPPPSTSACTSASTSGPFDFTTNQYRCDGGFKIEDGDLPNNPSKDTWIYNPSNGCNITLTATEWKDNELIKFNYTVSGDCGFDNVEVKFNTSYFLWDTNCSTCSTELGSHVYPDPATGNINGISHIQWCPSTSCTSSRKRFLRGQ